MNEELYFKDAFTEVDGSINIDVNNLNTNCITSNNNKFSLDSDGNLIVNSITTLTSNNIDFDVIYPVGSIYFSVNDINPSILFGGVWEQIRDRFLLASGDEYLNGSIGGESKHKLTKDEMPSHYHAYGYSIKTFYGSGPGVNAIKGVASHGSNDENYVWEQGSGGDKSHNNMPPYLTVNVWKRIS